MKNEKKGNLYLAVLWRKIWKHSNGYGLVENWPMLWSFLLLFHSLKIDIVDIG